MTGWPVFRCWQIFCNAQPDDKMENANCRAQYVLKEEYNKDVQVVWTRIERMNQISPSPLSGSKNKQTALEMDSFELRIPLLLTFRSSTLIKTPRDSYSGGVGVGRAGVCRSKMEGMDSLSEVGVDLGLLVCCLLRVRSVGWEHSHNLQKQAVNNTSHLADSSRNSELGLLVEDDQDGSGLGDSVHELEEALDELEGEV